MFKACILIFFIFLGASSIVPSLKAEVTSDGKGACSYDPSANSKLLKAITEYNLSDRIRNVGDSTTGLAALLSMVKLCNAFATRSTPGIGFLSAGVTLVNASFLEVANVYAAWLREKHIEDSTGYSKEQIVAFIEEYYKLKKGIEQRARCRGELSGCNSLIEMMLQN